jgi:hypothetical protein
MSNPNPSPKTRFKKGQSGNPKGKAPGTFSLTTAIKEYLLQQAKDGETYGDKLKKAAVLRAIAKSDVLTKEIWERMDGKVAQPTDINGEIVISFDESFKKKDEPTLGG